MLGHDWGGSIAWMYAFTHPEKLDNLIILSTPHPVLFMERMRTDPKQQATSQYARNFQKEGSEASMTAEALARRVQDPALHAKYLEAFQAFELCGDDELLPRQLPKDRGAGCEAAFPAGQSSADPCAAAGDPRDEGYRAAGGWAYGDVEQGGEGHDGGDGSRMQATSCSSTRPSW